MKKFIAIVISLVTVLVSVSGLYVGALPSETDNGIFYSIENGEVTVEGFNYVGTVMDVPETIEGYPVRYVADQACRGNEGIFELRLPKTIVSIGEYAFGECENLTKVVIKGADTIGYSAFRDCKALMTVTLSEGVRTIDDSAFEGCTNLGKIKIPSTVTQIGVDAFMGCERVRFDADSNKYALEYAKSNNIPTGFDPWTVRVIVIGVTSALLFGAVLLVDKAVKRAKKTKA